jgi:glycine cleavage system regulatory protein
MAHLGGQFTGILLVEMPEDRVEPLLQDLRQLESKGIRVVAQRTDHTPIEPIHSQILRLELVGQDRPGIVQQIARILSAHNVNVEELTTDCVSAPMSGEILFRARARVQAPKKLPLAALAADLEALAHDLMVDIQLYPTKDSG